MRQRFKFPERRSQETWAKEDWLKNQKRLSENKEKYLKVKQKILILDKHSLSSVANR